MVGRQSMESLHVLLEIRVAHDHLFLLKEVRRRNSYMLSESLLVENGMTFGSCRSFFLAFRQFERSLAVLRGVHSIELGGVSLEY